VIWASAPTPFTFGGDRMCAATPCSLSLRAGMKSRSATAIVAPAFGRVESRAGGVLGRIAQA
jgi:hypothetical protein